MFSVNRMNRITTIEELSKALDNHPINAPDMRGDYKYHLAGLMSEISSISELTSGNLSHAPQDSRQLGIRIGTCLLLLATIAEKESIDLTTVLPQALEKL